MTDGHAPSYMCEQHGNADIVFVYEADPKPAWGAVGVAYNAVIALPVDHYEGATVVVRAGVTGGSTPNPTEATAQNAPLRDHASSDPGRCTG
jgi:hypothetical protein